MCWIPLLSRIPTKQVGFRLGGASLKCNYFGQQFSTAGFICGFAPDRGLFCTRPRSTSRPTEGYFAVDRGLKELGCPFWRGKPQVQERR
jgi:hypothetical protein